MIPYGFPHLEIKNIAERTPILAKRLTAYNTEIDAGGKRAAIAKAKLQLGSMFYMATAPL